MLRQEGVVEGLGGVALCEGRQGVRDDGLDGGRARGRACRCREPVLRQLAQQAVQVRRAGLQRLRARQRSQDQQRLACTQWRRAASQR